MKQTTDKEKATACQKTPVINWCGIAESDFDKARRYKAHADKLAEALNVAQATIERLKQRYALGSVDGTLDVIFKALAAYEEAKQ